MRYSLASHIYLAELGDDVLLLDIQKQRYTFLPWVENPPFSPSHFFTELFAGTPLQGGPYHKALKMCLQAGWLCEEPSGESLPPPQFILPRRWLGGFSLHLEALTRFQQIDGVLSRRQFLPWIQALMALPVQSDAGSPRDLDRVVQAVREMARTFRQPKTCLHQSLVICWMLRTRGIPAQVAIRVQQHPLRSHMIVVNGAEVLSWTPGLKTIPTLEHFLAASVLLFHSGELSTHYRRQEGRA